MSAGFDVEQLETTKSEKLLATVLALFLLIGGIWLYVKIDDWTRSAISVDFRGTPAEQAAIQELYAAQQRVFSLRQVRAQARSDLELRREAYRTALEAGKPAGALEREYRRAQQTFARTGRELTRAEQDAAAARPAARVAEERLSRERQDRTRRQGRVAFLLRFVFVAATITSAYGLLGRFRKRGSRFLPLAFSAVVFGVTLALVLGVDYITDYVDPLDLGPLVLSLFGIGVTVLAFVALQRYLARRIPYRRVRRGECPFCGYPVRGTQHCEGCGRQTNAQCAHCSAPRRVGTLRCGACGSA